ncbi:peptidase inhibitor family I36 protein [Glycomyces sp. A-F 0318]|uniref:peptidase inhibitor family I36 protein n=1 Tax=Glycomyces amatae TaxID=2881355 RepID=UPI001E40F9E8|nr:peptidase inhibitor family I36 protein [Glycomyces amatae]MCD0447362.1 peptidase inhibitor family I36 protein [Glycomyces amatae]
MMRERAVTGIAAGLFAVAALGAPATAAPAAEGDPHDCPEQAVCFWTEPNFEGDRTVREKPGFDCDPAPGGQVMSITNHLNRPVWLYLDESCEEGLAVLVPSQSLDYVEPIGSWR